MKWTEESRAKHRAYVEREQKYRARGTSVPYYEPVKISDTEPFLGFAVMKRRGIIY